MDPSAQGDIEKVAQQSPVELAKFLEVISGSETLEKQYSSLQLAVEHADIKNGQLYAKKRSLQAKKKLTKEAKNEAEKFHQLGQVKVCMSVACGMQVDILLLFLVCFMMSNSTSCSVRFNATDESINEAHEDINRSSCCCPMESWSIIACLV